MDCDFGDAAPWFRSFGAPLRSQPTSDWAGPGPLPADVAAMYLELGPDGVLVPAHGDDVAIPSLAGLWDLQVGYRTHGATGERLLDWPDELLVVAHQGGDPIALDRSTGAVVTAQQGAGRWSFEPLGASLAPVVLGLGVLGAVVEAAWPDLCDAELRVHALYFDEAQRTLASLVGDDVASTLLRWAGWVPAPAAVPGHRGFTSGRVALDHLRGGGRADLLHELFRARVAEWHAPHLHVEGGTIGLFDDLTSDLDPAAAFDLLPTAVGIAVRWRRVACFGLALVLLADLARASGTTEVPAALADAWADLEAAVAAPPVASHLREAELAATWAGLTGWYRLRGPA